MKRMNDKEITKQSKDRILEDLASSSTNVSERSLESSREPGRNITSFLRKQSHQILRSEDIPLDDLEPLTKYTWYLYQVSPWCGFQESEVRLKQYGVFLRNYFSTLKVDDNDVEYKADFCVFDAFGKTAEDMAVTIEVSCCKNKNWKLIYGGIFLSWGSSKARTESIKHLPLLLCRGTVAVKQLVHDALQKLFDCTITQYFISQMDLIWINGLLVSVSTVRGKEEAIKLTLRPPWEDELRIEYKLILEDASTLWNRIHPEDSDILAIEEVKSFYDTIMQHISKQYKMSLKDFKIDRINYPKVGIAFNGKLKCQDIDIWNELLHILCSELHLIDVSKGNYSS